MSSSRVQPVRRRAAILPADQRAARVRTGLRVPRLRRVRGRRLSHRARPASHRPSTHHQSGADQHIRAKRASTKQPAGRHDNVRSELAADSN